MWCCAAGLLSLQEWWQGLQHTRNSTTNAGLKVYKPTTPGARRVHPSQIGCAQASCLWQTKASYIPASTSQCSLRLCCCHSPRDAQQHACRVQRAHHHPEGDSVAGAPLQAADRRPAQNRRPQQPGQNHILASRGRWQAPVS